MAELARLELEEDEAGELLDDLNGILEHMESLAEASAEPSEGSVEAHRKGGAPLRDGEEAQPDAMAHPPGRMAPAWKDGFFVVPRLPAVEGSDEEPEERAP